jgi:hypothetical protein
VAKQIARPIFIWPVSRLIGRLGGDASPYPSILNRNIVG